MTKLLNSDEDEPQELECMSPEEFLKHAQNLVVFEKRKKVIEIGKEKESSKTTPDKWKISSLAKLALDGIYDKEIYSETEAEKEADKNKLVKLLPKES